DRIVQQVDHDTLLVWSLAVISGITVDVGRCPACEGSGPARAHEIDRSDREAWGVSAGRAESEGSYACPGCDGSGRVRTMLGVGRCPAWEGSGHGLGTRRWRRGDKELGMAVECNLSWSGERPHHRDEDLSGQRGIVTRVVIDGILDVRLDDGRTVTV